LLLQLLPLLLLLLLMVAQIGLYLDCQEWGSLSRHQTLTPTLLHQDLAGLGQTLRALQELTTLPEAVSP
jgi:hypothetical protein